jgi:hypothetical protein
MKVFGFGGLAFGLLVEMASSVNHPVADVGGQLGHLVGGMLICALLGMLVGFLVDRFSGS